MQLLESLRIFGKIEADYLVLEQLAELSQRKPKEVVQCLGYLVKGDHEGWQIYHWHKEIRVILSCTIQGDEETRKFAQDLIHYIGSRGYLEFRDLLQ